MARQRLTDKFLQSKRAIPASGQVDVFDTTTPGFGVRIGNNGKRSFFVMYRWGARKARMTFKPPYPALSLTDARAHAREALEDVEAGIDPKAKRDAAKAEAQAAPEPETYRQAVEDYVERYQRGERQNATADEVRRVLLKEGENAGWLGRPIASIEARELRRHLEAVRDGRNDKARPYLANRLYAYLRAFFRWCAEPGIDKVERSPMEGLRRPWDGEASRERTFSDAEIAAIWQGADTLDAHRAAFVKLSLLLGKRKGALAAMRFDEIEDNGIWNPPQDNRRRSRTKRTHGVPLPALALRIIRALPQVDGNPYVFPGRKHGGHLDPGTPLQRAVQRASGVHDFYWHAARHTVETRLAALEVPPHVRDLVLDHAPARGAGAGYDHHTYAREMREALEAWCGHVEGALREHSVWASNVEPLRG